ncbi:hypothetical protein HRI_004089100 [Hibiscus trionum]|uniref:Retrotransposon gag domain-containing protein n=1 Tax=Hibiscus trionum TaxID=183268 RepID=A0A9W7J2H5_HIBTR|nr:hypothetical protein HRI_004089100 [Hibiscus trionum]
MEGIAKRWFRWMQRRRQLAGWDHLIEAIQKRFAIIEIESPKGQLTELTQTTTVEDYQNRFEEIALRTSDLPEIFLIQCFISSLPVDIKNEVLASQVNMMQEVVAVARFHEAKTIEDKHVLGRSGGPKLPPLLPTPVYAPSGLKTFQ